MNNKVYILLLVVFFLLTKQSFSQQPDNTFIQDIIETIAQETEDEVDFSMLAEELTSLNENPIDINKATKEQLEKLIMLNDFQILSLANYIKKHGKLLTIYELQNIDGFNSKTINIILPFIQINTNQQENKWSLKNALKYGKHNLFVRFTTLAQQPEGYKKGKDLALQANPNKYYLGNKHRIYSRYYFNYKNKLKFGITAEKDPGEHFFTKTQKYGFDFYSGHLQINDLSIVKTLIIGDYQALLGQGLTMWSYLSMGKSAYVMDIRKKGQGLKKYSSVDENTFLRGIGSTIEIKNFSLTTFGSYKKIDANVNNSSDTLSIDENLFTSFDKTGIHATPMQLQKKDAITEMLVGINAGFKTEKLKIGLTGVGIKYNMPLIKNTRTYNLYDFQGNENYNLSADFQYSIKKLYFFGEIAMSQNTGKAFLSGVLMNFSDRIQGSILYRNFEPQYQSVYGNAFRESGKVANEKGIFMGLELHPIKKITIAGYYDFFKYPWLKIFSNSPSMGSDYLIKVDYKTSRNLNMYIQFKQKNKQRNVSEETTGLKKLGAEQKTSGRYNLWYKINQNWTIKSRIELTKYKMKNKTTEYGYMVYQDVSCSPFNKLPLNISLRYAMFETDGFASRIYAYESDVLYAYSLPAMYYKGTRFYVLLRYKLGKHIDFWMRYHQTWYSNKKSIGNGLNEIKDNLKSEIKLQMRYRF